MADEKGYVKITDEQLSKSAVKYRKEWFIRHFA